MGGGGKPSVDDLDLREGPKIWAPGGADSGDDKDFKPVKFDSNSLKKNKNNQVNTQLECLANCTRTIVILLTREKTCVGLFSFQIIIIHNTLHKIWMYYVFRKPSVSKL